MIISELQRTAYKAIDQLIEEFVKKGIPINCPNIYITTYEEGSSEKSTTIYAELLEMADGTWNIEEIVAEL